jgi:rubrerythrin
MSGQAKTGQAKNLDPFWKCGNRGNTIQAASPPDRCPACKENCEFKDVSCYTPDCGGPGTIDPRL